MKYKLRLSEMKLEYNNEGSNEIQQALNKKLAMMIRERKKKKEVSDIRRKYEELEVASLNYSNIKAYDHYMKDKGIDVEIA